MVDHLSRSDARAAGDDTVSIDGSSNGTVPEKLTYPHFPSDHLEDLETQTSRANDDLTTRVDLKQVYTSLFNPLTPTAVIWVQLWSFLLSVRVPGCQKLQMTA